MRAGRSVDEGARFFSFVGGRRECVRHRPWMDESGMDESGSEDY